MIRIINGDCLVELPKLEAESIDACVTDPPYHLTSGKPGGSGAASVNPNSPAGRAMIGTGFMGKAWDGGDIAFRSEVWEAIFRVLKPGAYLLAFGGTRTSHRMVCAIEDAGFEIRDTVAWLYGSGFPKSLNVSKAIDKAAGATREVVGRRTDGPSSWMLDQKIEHRANGGTGMGYADGSGKEYDVTAPATPEAEQWQGWGTSLKPAMELICVARKPLIGTVAANVLRHGTGAINIDACRIGIGVLRSTGNGHRERDDGWHMDGGIVGGSELGRWPANLVHDGSEEVLAAFPVTSSGQPMLKMHTDPGRSVASGAGLNGGGKYFHNGIGDSGSAARFYYTAKADAQDRQGSKHPTVKPTDLMRWMVRLVTPPSGTVLDPFCGTGSTLLAADQEQFNAIGIEKDEAYAADVRRKLLSDAPLLTEIVKPQRPRLFS